MLTYIKITNFALIENAELEFGKGFNVVTGESGAGKSILMGAVELLLGGRVDKNIIRSGCDRCTVCGSVAVPPVLAAELAGKLEESDIPCEKGSELQFRRVITANSVRNFLNDTPVSAKLLSDIGSLLIDLHGANEQISLLVPARQLELLDRFADNSELRLACADIFRQLEVLRAEREAFEKDLPDADEVSRLELILEDINAVNPAPGEDEEITAKFNLASNSRQVLESSGMMINALTDGENTIADQLGSVYRKLLELSKSDEKSISPLLELCDSIQESVSTLSENISVMADKVDLDAEELAALESRLSSLYTLKRRYGPTLEQVLAQKADAENRLRLHKESQKCREEFDRKEKELQDRLKAKAQELSAVRRKKAEELTALARQKAHTVGLEKSTINAQFETIPPGANGCDRMEFYFSANAGEEPMPLRRIASSGELSRLMLALKTVLADADAVPVVVFDEIDANIGGETAARVGRELRALGKKRQILCISHQALVAAQAESHFCVEKHTQGDRTFSNSRLLEKEERTAELGRMLGGGPSALAHAKAILRDVSK